MTRRCLSSLLATSSSRRGTVRAGSWTSVCNSMVAHHRAGGGANVQPVSCDQEFQVQRDYEIEATPEDVWDELPDVLDEADRVRVVEREDAPHHLSFFWTPVDGDEPPSHVEIDLEPSTIGTIVHIRETRLTGAEL